MPRLVLLPGLNGSSSLFAPLLACLDPAIERCTLSLPTQGPQDYPSLGQTLADRLGDSAFVLLGESFSSPLVYQLAQQQPAGLRGVIFAAAFLSRPHPLLPLTRYLPLPRWLLSRSSLLRLFGLNGGASPDVLQAVGEEIDRLPSALLRARLHSLSLLQAPQQPLELPALHLLPSQDRLVRRQARLDLHRHCRQLSEVTIAGPHFLLQSQPQACARAIEHFMRGLTAQ